MSLREDELDTYVKKTFREQWTRRAGQKVPETEDLGLANVAVDIDGTVLYADLAESTQLVNNRDDWFAAEVYKNYLYCAAKIIRWNGGTVTAYDGDRVMGVFIGDNKNTAAAKAALQIKSSVSDIVQPALDAQYPNAKFTVKQKVGVDTSSLMVARTGIRGSNDLVWVGTAANNAAKLAALSTLYSSYISAAVYGMLNDSSKFGPNGENMWTDLGSRDVGYRIYGSNWKWGV